MNNLNGKTIAVLALDGFEEAELTEPTKALRDAGATVEIVSQKREPLQAFKHHDKSIKVDVDKTFDEVSPADYDAVLLPGGALNADTLRTDPKAQQFVKRMNDERKPMAVICHAPWLLVSAGLVKGRTLTSWPTIADDIRNAGGEWVDREVVVDDNLVTSRGPKDIPAFNRALLDLLTRSPQPVA
ncbi:MAG: type 1 glutamine amidotransferase [Candidatus Eremiobacteraeota bacterium]|nr:type 1 glutamine amidotransferase [Candidatus Eremiobacteraeota bacterium]